MEIKWAMRQTEMSDGWEKHWILGKAHKGNRHGSLRRRVQNLFLLLAQPQRIQMGIFLTTPNDWWGGCK